MLTVYSVDSNVTFMELEKNKTLTVQEFDSIDPDRIDEHLPPGFTQNDIFALRDKIAAKSKELNNDWDKLKAPINESLKKLRNNFKPLIEKLDLLKKVLNNKLFEMQQEASRIEDEKRMEKMRLLAKQNAKKVTAALPIVEEEPEIIEEPVKKVRLRSVQKFTLLSFADVPDEYKILNEVKIKSDGRSGANVPGIKFWKEDVPY